MYSLDDTIVAVSSPSCEQRVIIRISGPRTLAVLNRLCASDIPSEPSLGGVSVVIEKGLDLPAKLYLFIGPRSYTGEDLAELHIYTNAAVIEALLGKLLAEGVRAAGPGEFTARAYLNGKMDLAQAEAVNEIVVASNRYQLAASQRLLAGRLAQAVSGACEKILDCLSLIEAGLDFSNEDIECISARQAIRMVGQIKTELEHLTAEAINCEKALDLPAIGIAGAPNAGKSTLLNTLLGRSRSIVSEQQRTTRDILTGLLELEHCRCVLFDCAGLVAEPVGILDQLAQQAAIEALSNSDIVLFCIDLSKTDYSEDLAISSLIEPKNRLGVATKCDLVEGEERDIRLAGLNRLFGFEFLAVSAVTGEQIEKLKAAVDKMILELGLSGSAGGRGLAVRGQQALALTARHHQAVIEAIANLDEAMAQIGSRDEIAAMFLRAAYQSLSQIQQVSIDEQVLERIFSRFCIGK